MLVLQVSLVAAPMVDTVLAGSSFGPSLWLGRSLGGRCGFLEECDTECQRKILRECTYRVEFLG